MDESVVLDAARQRLTDRAEPVERTDRVPISVATGRVTAVPVTAREAVPEAGVAVGDELLSAGHRLRVPDVTLLKAAGVDDCAVRQRPTVGVVPTGDELVQREAGADERVEVTGFGVTQLADEWGAKVTYRDIVSEVRPSLRAAVQRDLTRDALVLTGVQREDVVRDVVADLGTVHAADVALRPGAPAAVATVEGRPTLLLPESPVGCLVAARQLLGPLLAALSGAPLALPPTTDARLGDPIESEPGVRAFVPVTVADSVARPVARDPTLADVTRADGWVAVPEDTVTLAIEERVTVERWA